jgi:hypothetical protein
LRSSERRRGRQDFFTTGLGAGRCAETPIGAQRRGWRASAMKDFQAEMEQNPNPAERNPNSKSFNFLADSSLFNDLRRPHGIL